MVAARLERGVAEALAATEVLPADAKRVAGAAVLRLAETAEPEAVRETADSRFTEEGAALRVLRTLLLPKVREAAMEGALAAAVRADDDGADADETCAAPADVRIGVAEAVVRDSRAA